MKSGKERKTPSVLVALPLAYQDGRDKYNGMMRYLASRNVEWDIHLVRGELSLPAFRQSVRDGSEGIIADFLTSEDVFRHLDETDFPCAVIDMGRPELLAHRSRNIAFIDIDSEVIGRRGAEYLLGQGDYSSFGYFGFSPDCRWSDARAKSFAATLEKRGHLCRVFSVPRRPFLNDATVAALQEDLLRLPKPAALLTANDEVARIVLDLCRHGNFRVPGEIAVLGVDNEQIICTHMTPSLSSIQPDFEHSGFQAALWMDKILTGQFRGRIALTSPILQIIGRASTAPSSSAGKMVIKAEEFIRANACKGIHVEDVVQALRVSRRLLDLRFREITGHTVLGSIQTARLAQIKNLLLTTSLPIGEICNFCSENHLKRLFKLHFGITMRDFRRQRR